MSDAFLEMKQQNHICSLNGTVDTLQNQSASQAIFCNLIFQLTQLQFKPTFSSKFVSFIDDINQFLYQKRHFSYFISTRFFPVRIITSNVFQYFTSVLNALAAFLQQVISNIIEVFSTCEQLVTHSSVLYIIIDKYITSHICTMHKLFLFVFDI